jgi:ankyrin repeat protein
VSVEDKLQQPSNNPGKKTNEAARKGYWCEIRWPHPGARAIHLALEFGNDDVVRTLIASGAKINEEDSKGWRPLHYAAWNCRPFMVELLLVRGASPHNTTDDGSNPLSLGFREHGLAASMDERQSVFELLQAAMNARRKSTLSKISEFKGIGPRKTRDVGERNRAWHTAELAAALYLAGQLEDSESDRLSQLAPSMNSLNRRESREQEVTTPTQASSSRVTKRPSD